MTGHLGNRASALLDGQLSAEEADRAWAHVYDCHACRDLVEREGWVKARLARLTRETAAPAPGASSSLKGALSGLTPGDVMRVLDYSRTQADRRRTTRVAGLAALGGGAAGAAVVGILALGAAPAGGPVGDLRVPVSGTPTGTPTVAVGPVAPVGPIEPRTIGLVHRHR